MSSPENNPSYVKARISKIAEAAKVGQFSNEVLQQNLKWSAQDPERIKQQQQAERLAALQKQHRSRNASGEDNMSSTSKLNDLPEPPVSARALSEEARDASAPGVVTITRRNNLLDQSLKLDSAASDAESSAYQTRVSTLEATELRSRLANERNTFQRKLAAYQEGQQRQQQLVQKLQQKVLQYKRRCSELETTIGENSSSHDKTRANLQEDVARLTMRLDQANEKLRASEMSHSTDIDDIVDRYEREKNRNQGLQDVNTMLREENDVIQSENTQLKEQLKNVKETQINLEDKVHKNEMKLQHERDNIHNFYASEHQKLVALWKSVLLIKREFSDLSATTHKDVDALRSTVLKEKRILTTACNSFSNSLKRESITRVPSEALNSITAERDALDIKLRKREAEVKDIKYEYEEKIAKLEGKLISVNGELNQSKEDLNILSNSKGGSIPLGDSGIFCDAIEEIARKVVNEKDLHIGIEELPPQQSRRSRSPSPMRSRAASPERRIDVKPELAANTINAVAQALRKRNEQISALKDALDTTKTNLTDLQIVHGEVESNLKDTQSRLEKTRNDRDDYHMKAAEAKREIAQLKNALETVEADQKSLNRSKDNLEHQIARQDKQVQNLKSQDDEHRDKLRSLESERDEARDKAMQLGHRLEQLEQQKSILDDRNEKAKQTIVELRELLNDQEMSLNVLKAERANLESALSKRDVDNAELQVKIQTLKGEENQLREQLNLYENELCKVEADKRRLNEQIHALEKTLGNTQEDRSELTLQKENLKDELLKKEAEAEDLANAKLGLGASLEVTEKTKAALEVDLNAAVCERNELSEAYAKAQRKMDNLEESFAITKDECDKQAEALLILTQEKEVLAKSKSELISKLHAHEREIRQLQNSVAAYKADKDQLENSLYDAQNQCLELEKKRTHLEQINSNLSIKNEALQGEIARQRKELETEILKLEKSVQDTEQALLRNENEAERTLKSLNRSHEDEVNNLVKEREAIRTNAISVQNATEKKFKYEKENLITNYENKLENMHSEIDGIIDDHNQALIDAEQEKQTAINDYEKRLVNLNEKMSRKQLQLQEKSNDIENLRRENTTLAEEMARKVADFTQQIADKEHTLALAEDKHCAESKSLQKNIAELQSLRDKLNKELDDLNLKHKLLDEAKENQRQELQNTIRNLRDVNQKLDSAKKEINDLKRDLNSEITEKDNLNRNLQDLRILQAKLEDQKQQLEREREELSKKSESLTDTKHALIREGDGLRATLRDVEKSRTELRKEVADVRSQLKDAEAETDRTNVALSDTKARLINTEEREDDVRRECSNLRHALADTETALAGADKEAQILSKRIADLEDEAIIANRSFMTQKVEMVDKEARLKDNITDLCAKTDQLSDEVSGLRLELGEAQGRAEALHEDLIRTEDTKDNLEQNLTGIASALRRTLGVGKKGKDDTDSVAIPSPDLVKASLQTFVLELQQTKAARDDAKLQVEQTERKLRETDLEKEAVQERLEQIQRTLGETENSKRGADNRLANAQTAILLQEEAIRRADRERKTLADRLGEAERQIKDQERKNTNLINDLDTAHSGEARLQEERRRLKDLLDQGEARFTKLEIERRGLEGNLHRSQVTLADKDGEIVLLNERIEALQTKFLEGEQKASELKQHSDKTRIELDRSNALNSNLKERIQALTLGLSEKDGQLGSDQQKITHLEQLLTASEHDRQIMVERLETARQLSEELKKKQAQLGERIVNKEKKSDDLDLRRQELEGVVKTLTSDLDNKKQSEDVLRQRITKLSDERKQLAERVTGLQRAVTQLASEKQQEHKDLKTKAKEVNKLKKDIDNIEKDKVTTDFEVTRLTNDKASLEAKLLETKSDNRELRETIKKLEMQIMKVEQLYERRIADQNDKFSRDMEIEIDRARHTAFQSERTLEARERANRQRISLLEDSNQDLREQIDRSNRSKKRNHRQTQELLSDIRRSASPKARLASPTRY